MTANHENEQPSKSGINVDFLKEIAEETSKSGRRFLLPVADPNAMQKNFGRFDSNIGRRKR